MQVLKYTDEDFDALYSIEKKCFPDYWSEEGMKNELSQPKAYYCVAKVGDFTVGYAGFWLIADEAEIMKVAVDPQYRKKGIGNLLLNWILEEAGKMGAKSVFLEVRCSNKPARRLYEANGFEIYGTRKGYYSGNEYAVLYRRNL